MLGVPHEQKLDVRLERLDILIDLKGRGVATAELAMGFKGLCLVHGVFLSGVSLYRDVSVDGPLEKDVGRHGEVKVGGRRRGPPNIQVDDPHALLQLRCWARKRGTSRKGKQTQKAAAIMNMIEATPCLKSLAYFRGQTCARR